MVSESVSLSVCGGSSVAVVEDADSTRDHGDGILHRNQCNTGLEISVYYCMEEKSKGKKLIHRLECNDNNNNKKRKRREEDLPFSN